MGIAPAGFAYPNVEPELWTPLAVDAATAAQEGRFLSVLGRLRTGVTLEQAQAHASGVAARLARATPALNAGLGANIETLRQELYGDEFELASLICTVAVGFVLLIACANVANLQLVRSAARQRELALRAALGAGRRRVLRQLLTESLLLALLGGAAGGLLAVWGVPLLKGLFPAGTPRLENVTLSLRVLLYTAVVSLASGVVFGLAPALQASTPQLEGALREGGRGTTASRGAARLRKLLVAGEIALALVLLVSTALMVKGFQRLRSQETGFDPAGVLTMSLAPPESKYPADSDVNAFYPQLLAGVRALPGVQEAAFTSVLPMAGETTSGSFEVEGRPLPEGERPVVNFRSVSPGYLPALRIPLLSGRMLNEADDADAPRVLLVNRAFARRHFGGLDPVGRRLLFDSADPARPARVAWTIAGMVGDVREHGFDTAPPASAYFPYPQHPWRNMDLVVRTASDPASLTGAVRSRLAEL
ncbi:MAG: ABC transporter permease, partial [Gemmatimonadetes bacterium]|nr:ABC transporter permease [Gemmatimonadota bacterium]